MTRSFNGGEDKPRTRAKPNPLADRIDPLQARLNKLDQLERELDNDQSMPYERAMQFRRSLTAQRHALHKRIDKRDGVIPEAEPISEEWQTFVLPWHVTAGHKLAYAFSHVKPWHFWCVLALIIFTGLRK